MNNNFYPLSMNLEEKAFTVLLDFAKENDLFVRWGTKGFSLNVRLETDFVGLCCGYPPNSVYRQSIYIVIEEIRKKVKNGDEIILDYKKMLSSFNHFISAKSNYKWIIDKSFKEEYMIEFCAILSELKSKIEQNT